MVTTEHWRGGRAQQLNPWTSNSSEENSNLQVIDQGYCGFYWRGGKVQKVFVFPKGKKTNLG